MEQDRILIENSLFFSVTTDSHICKGITRQREVDDDDGGIPVKKQRIEE